MTEGYRRKLGFIAALALLSAVAWTGHTITVPEASGSPALTVSTAGSAGTQHSPLSFTEIAKSTTPAVVHIKRTAEPSPTAGREGRDREEWMEKFYESPGARPGPGAPHGRSDPRRDPWGPRGGGMGSGVIVSPDGHIVTNHHVVGDARHVTVTLPDKREFTGKVIGNDPKTDLAVLKIDAKDLPYVPWGESSRLQVGEPVLAVGNPFGLTSTVTSGIVSAMGRGRMGITQYEDFIQTDAAINPGNSGGALVNTRGELVGISTAIVSRSGGYQGVGFAIPSSMAKPIYRELVESGKVVRGYLGIGIQDVTPGLAESFELKEAKGALVGDVKKGSPAETGGLKRGDVITRYEGKDVEDPLALQRFVTGTEIGAKARMTVVRDGKERELTIRIGEQPDATRIARAEREEAERARVGLAVRDLDKEAARRFGLGEEVRGIVVLGVMPGSSADKAGLIRGDVIREVNGQPIKSVSEFKTLTAGIDENERMLLLVNRRGATLFVSVKI